MKVIPAVRWLLEPEQVKMLETEYLTFFDLFKSHLLNKLSAQMAEIDPVINYLAWLMFDPKDSDEEEK